MSLLRPAAIPLLLLLLSALVLPLRGQSGIVVNNADSIRTEVVTPTAELNMRLDQAAARIVAQYANRVRHSGLAISPAVQTLLDAVPARVSVEYANRVRHSLLLAPPEGLQALLDSAAARIVFQYANRNFQVALRYPRELLPDPTPPVIPGIDWSSDGGNLVVLWVTDEFARCTLTYGTQSGVYTESIDNPLYLREQQATLPELAPGATLFFLITCTDQSDNTMTTPELTLKGVQQLFLPLVRR